MRGRGSTSAAWALRSAVLVMVTGALAGLPAVAGATTPPTGDPLPPETTVSALPTSVPTSGAVPTGAVPTAAAGPSGAVATGAAAPCASESIVILAGPQPRCPAPRPTAEPGNPAPTDQVTPIDQVVPTGRHSAGRQSAAPQYGTVGMTVIPRGQEQSATGHNFTPGTLVKVTLEPGGTDLGTHPVGPDGTVTTWFATTSLLPGTHTVRWTPV